MRKKRRKKMSKIRAQEKKCKTYKIHKPDGSFPTTEEINEAIYGKKGKEESLKKYDPPKVEEKKIPITWHKIGCDCEWCKVANEEFNQGVHGKKEERRCKDCMLSKTCDTRKKYHSTKDCPDFEPKQSEPIDWEWLKMTIVEAPQTALEWDHNYIVDKFNKLVDIIREHIEGK